MGECENKLREYYNISENETLLIFKIDFYEEGFLIPIVNYEIYNIESKEMLNLTNCQNEKIKILFPAIIDKKENFKYNMSSDYYNNICYIYTTKSRTDITLKDRKEEFNKNNMSLCESNCEYEGYNLSIKKSECICQTKIKMSSLSEIIKNKNKLLKKFVHIKSSINIFVMKCYDILFCLKGIKNNIGSYILLSIIFISICCFVIYLFKGNNMINKIIDKVVQIKKNQFNNKKEIAHKNNIRKKKKKRKETKFKIFNMENAINITNINNNVNKNNKIKKKKKKYLNNPPFKKTIKKGKKLKNKYINKLEANTEDNTVNIFSKFNVINIYSPKKKEKNVNSTKSILNFNNILSNFKQNLNSQNAITYNDYNDYELNTLDYKEAFLIDKRSYIQYYCSLIRQKQLLVFTFYTYNDYNLRVIKICLFLFNFSLYYTVNALFFNDSTMHKIYEEQGNYNFIDQIPQILYSSIICAFINILITYISLSEKNIIKLKNNHKKGQESINIILKCLKIKFTLFFILLFLFLILFWYYISCFCAVYKNTQTILIKDTIFSFTLSLIYPIGLYLIPGIFRIPSLRDKNSDKDYCYIVSKIIQLII